MPGERFSITRQFTDAGERYHMKLGNSALPGLFAAAGTGGTGGVTFDGDTPVSGRLLALLKDPEPDFAVSGRNPDVAPAHAHIHLAVSRVQSNAVRPPVLRRRSMK